ncbi:hypothetical protein F5Y15DRAFT_374425 [Xylariaceae sp. FL0016]|nr:hypothetical protein F5Y15DRAFT_374425 [Xylariaceae sp. FL0016]
MEAGSSDIASARRWATAEEWTRLQPVIMKLYIDEDLCLEDVKAHMAQHHHFFATLSMYKRRLSSWNAFKNLRSDEVLQILRLKKDRDAANKESAFFIRDREVEMDSIQIYLSRNPSVYTKLQAGTEPGPDAVRDVMCCSPSPASTLADLPASSTRSSSIPSPSETQSIPDELLQLLRSYFDECFENGLWSWSTCYCWNMKGQRGPTELLNALLDRCMTAALSVDRQAEPVAIRHALDSPFTMLVRVFRNPPPILIPKILCTAANLELVGRGEIESILLRFCRDLAHSSMGTSHSLSRFWQGVLDIPISQRRGAIGDVLTTCVAEFEKRLGTSHPLPTEVYLMYFDVIGRRKDPTAQVLRLQRQASKLDDNFPDSAVMGLLKLELALASCKMNLEQNELEKAEEVLLQLDAQSLAPKDQSFRFIWLAYVQWTKGDTLTAERSYADAVLAAKKTGSQDCICESLYQLETFYLHTGEPLEAERVRAERLDMLRYLRSIVWADNGKLMNDETSQTRSDINIIRIGSGTGSAGWRPSAFAMVKEWHESSRFTTPNTEIRS